MFDTLNERFAIAGKLHIAPGPSGLAHIFVEAQGAQAEIALQGGHVVRYGRVDAPPVLWASRQAIYAPGKAIRGGIPICWPWFGPHPDDLAKPQHGIVRTAMWQLRATGMVGDAIWVRLGITDSAATAAIWPHAFDLELTVTVGIQLDVALTARNRGDSSFSCGGALHSYFAVADATTIAIEGLARTRYRDKVVGGEHFQEGPVTIASEVDRVYRDTTATCTIVDSVLKRRIVVAKAGSRTTVVWNPWIEKARQMADYAADEYRQMVCVETANADEDLSFLPPGVMHTLRTTISVE
jgi:glucose-6-phosphate 1-epimerase